MVATSSINLIGRGRGRDHTKLSAAPPPQSTPANRRSRFRLRAASHAGHRMFDQRVIRQVRQAAKDALQFGHTWTNFDIAT